MTVKIKKLTPPQIEALREALPYAVESGALVTSASIATFEGRKAWSVLRLLRSRKEKALEPVIYKLMERPDLVDES